MPSFNLLAAACASRSSVASAQRLINLYPEINADQSITLYGTPGKRLFSTIGNGPIRGGLSYGEVMYIVSGTEVYSVDVLGAATLLGTLSSGYGRVYTASNGIDILLVDGVSGYRIVAGVLSEIADADFPDGVTWCDYVDGFYLVGGDGTQKFYKSESLDGSAWDALDFASAEGDPDNLRRGIVTNREILLFGDRSLEFWTNTGIAGFPFERSGNAFVEQGVAAPASVAKLDASVFWLGRNAQGEGMVWRLDGYTPVRVSTHDIEHEIASWGDITDAYAWAYVQEGHAFYVLSSVSGDITLVYDAATGQWHQRRFRDSDNNLHRDRGYCYVMHKGSRYVGDWENGNFYELDLDYYTDNGSAIVRELVAQHVRTGVPVSYMAAEVYMETGVGLQSGQGSDPQIMLSTSKDYGRTFPVERWKTFGAVGSYQARVRWHALGYAIAKTFKLRITDPVKVAITGARVEFSE